ncbi:MAG: extracellular solute-binding protein, partial [Actinomycetales bacterium]
MTAGALVMGSLAACASGARDADPGEPATVRWYVEDASRYAVLARTCSDGSDGDYRLDELEAVVADPQERRIDLLQRLRTGDDIDVIGLDTALVAEVSASGLLADLTDTDADDVTDGRTEASVASVTVDGAVVAAPWSYEPQVLFHRGSTAERAGLDMTAPVTWNQVSGGAARIGGSLQIAGTTTDWIRALVAGA